MGNQSSQSSQSSIDNPVEHMDSYPVEFIAQICHFTVQQVHGLLNIWKKDYNSKLELNEKEFMSLIEKVQIAFPHPGLENENFRKTFFVLFDQNHNGKLQFSEVLEGLAILCSGDIKEKARLVFESIDINNDKQLSHKEISDALSKCMSTAQYLLENQLRAAVNPTLMASIKGWAVSKLTGTCFWLLDFPTSQDFETELFKIDTRKTGSITRDEWIAASASNQTLKYFLEFNSGDFLRKVDFQGYVRIIQDPSKTQIEKNNAFRVLIDSYSPILKLSPPK